MSSVGLEKSGPPLELGLRSALLICHGSNVRGGSDKGFGLHTGLHLKCPLPAPRSLPTRTFFASGFPPHAHDIAKGPSHLPVSLPPS